MQNKIDQNLFNHNFIYFFYMSLIILFYRLTKTQMAILTQNHLLPILHP